MKKRILTTIMASLLVCGGFMGCGKSEIDEPVTPAATETNDDAAARASYDPDYSTFLVDLRYMPNTWQFGDYYNSQYYGYAGVSYSNVAQDQNYEYYSYGTYPLWGFSAYWQDAYNTLTEDQFGALNWELDMDVYLDSNGYLLNMENTNGDICEAQIYWNALKNVWVLKFECFSNDPVWAADYEYEFGSGQSPYGRKLSFGISQLNGTTYLSLPDYNLNVTLPVEINPFYFSSGDSVYRLYRFLLKSTNFA